ncbi:hypothetical protein DFH08DRAFT_800090 [Mycena albidolilacea]|uniref:Uncharacterized protein n=1 Tax=Mycena albidolilacea TaxID=1033008 RepID=A0AAD7AMY3_9AGAR|nr:hypothetical protein DFH08DRAFT_800090 [Mycena albidolilacea]
MHERTVELGSILFGATCDTVAKIPSIQQLSPRAWFRCLRCLAIVVDAFIYVFPDYMALLAHTLTQLELHHTVDLKSNDTPALFERRISRTSRSISTYSTAVPFAAHSALTRFTVSDVSRKSAFCALSTDSPSLMIGSEGQTVGRIIGIWQRHSSRRGAPERLILLDLVWYEIRWTSSNSPGATVKAQSSIADVLTSSDLNFPATCLPPYANVQRWRTLPLAGRSIIYTANISHSIPDMVPKITHPAKDRAGAVEEGLPHRVGVRKLDLH